ncbi:carbon storage regulator CsrA [Paenibacillus larvae]|uniref:Translational regulator CsrA n=4 Tax=Paenibacillus larvae TaxID=1464 RepID=V9W2X4_9BACL|nr:carbon storage regulator CsrA [Paenibacillus larvae]AHD03990.1 putative carbon storage regulator protein [Paenibacillus larvae subsp. larvae DSM 25430]AQR78618.1 carbon storage regulator [Paenibacillus larvae subsp. larvae]ARF68472.1 carbon storage regulator [Paenibacillus larvae subsp. pulvifaciens]AVF20128.1 putative carbon storage regulator protein [Paenibacillus larvae subsp. larvae]AVG10595.1 putative carbon storage regulator protein [Paenibacillus larvae subsp. larvae DSM 25430]
MLVLSRRKGESIILQENIEITILQVDSDTVKVGITAPKDVDIFRKEVYLAIQEANTESAQYALDIKELNEKLKKFSRAIKLSERDVDSISNAD